jgi:hypothetical protein
VLGDYLFPALNLWSWGSGVGNKQKQSQPSEFDFEIVWCSHGSCSGLDRTSPDQDVNFTYYQFPTTGQPVSVPLTSAQQDVIKQNALNSLRLAFSAYNVSVNQGRQGTNTVYIVGQYPSIQNGSIPCADTFSLTGIFLPGISRDYYLVNMEQAQKALGVQSPSPTQDILAAIGEGLGNNAAHEIAHQLVNAFGASGKVVNGMGLHDDSTDTYNGGSCQEPENPWVFTSYYNGVPISWGADAVTSLTNILGKKTQ